MQISDLDLGGSHPFLMPIVGQTTGQAVIEGSETITWPRGSIPRNQTVTFYLQAWQAIGGAAANTQQAAIYLVKQLEELVSNRYLNPAYIQWTMTSQPNQYSVADPHDGWYVITDFEPDYSTYIVSGIVKCSMSVTQVAPQVPRRMAVSYLGGALSSNFTGTALNLIALPIGSTAVESSVNRTGAEGAIPTILSPAASPEPYVPPSSISNYFLGGVRVYDTINTTQNPVPTAAAIYVNTNWVEVKFTDHDFKGDCVVTNGLQLLLFQPGVSRIATCYLWSTGQSSASWQQWATLNAAAQSAALRNFTLLTVSPEECALVVNLTASNLLAAEVIRLQRGRYDIKVDLTPLSAALGVGSGIELTFPSTPKLIYNSAAVGDNILSENPLTTIPTDYGYAATFVASTTYPFLAGFLYQNQPGNGQPGGPGNVAYIDIGDTTSLAINARRSYGIFAAPYGVSGSYSPANLQAEAESGSTSGAAGWASTTDNLASASSAERLASGSLTGAILQFGTSFIPAFGTGRAWFRLKVAGVASTVSQFKFGLYDTASSAYASSVAIAPSAASTVFAWYAAGASFTPQGGHNMVFRCESTQTTTTVFTVDEAAFTPQTLTADNRGPQDLYQQYAYDRSTRIVRV